MPARTHSFDNTGPSGRCGQVAPEVQLVDVVENRLADILRYALATDSGEIMVSLSPPRFEDASVVAFDMNATGTNVSSAVILRALDTATAGAALLLGAQDVNPSAFGGVVNTSLEIGGIATDGISAGELVASLWGKSIVGGIKIKVPTRGQTVGFLTTIASNLASDSDLVTLGPGGAILSNPNSAVEGEDLPSWWDDWWYVPRAWAQARAQARARCFVNARGGGHQCLIAAPLSRSHSTLWNPC